MSVKITKATALPIEAIASSLNRTARIRHATVWNSSPADSLGPLVAGLAIGAGCAVLAASYCRRYRAHRLVAGPAPEGRA